MRQEIRRPGRFLLRIPAELILKFMCLAAAQPVGHFQPWGAKVENTNLSVSVGRKWKRHLFPLSLSRRRRREGTALQTPGLEKTGSAESTCVVGDRRGGGGVRPHISEGIKAGRPIKARHRRLMTGICALIRMRHSGLLHGAPLSALS